MIMYQNRSPSYHCFDVIDLDPYGSCSIFLDGAVQYGANCPKTPFCHELAVRILLYTIQMTAARYGRSMEVLGAFQIDFYVRCFVRM